MIKINNCDFLIIELFKTKVVVRNGLLLDRQHEDRRLLHQKGLPLRRIR